MASTYVNDLRLNEMATGDQSGSWGTVTNTNLELIAEAFSFGTEGITTNADTHTTTIADGATDPGRSMFLKYTGTLDSACTITIAPNTVSKLWFIQNSTSGSQNIIISQGSGANVTIPAGQTKSVYSDGAGSGAAIVDAFATLNVVDLLVDDDLTVVGDLDVDGTTNLDIIDVDGAANFAADVTFADGADIITASAGTSNFRAGVNAGNSITSGGNYNVVVGDEAGTAVTTGVQNTLIGALAGDGLTDADYNVAVGYQALGADTLGSRSTAIGAYALDAQNFTSATNALNTAVGFQAGTSVTTGIQNALFGSVAGSFLSDADYNTAVGHSALTSDTLGSKSVAVGTYTLNAQNFTSATDSYNVAVGYQAGAAVTTGTSNTLIGGLAGDAITTGGSNVALGTSALSANTTASENTAVGYQAGYANTTGAEIVAVGERALTANTTGSYNTALGRVAMFTNTTGASNTAVGNNALRSNTTASNNTAVGYQAGYSNTTGAAQTFIGINAGYSVTTGTDNTMLGADTGYATTTGNYNTGLGKQALRFNTTASNNTAVGYQAGYDNTTGTNLVFMGVDSGANNTTGQGNTFLGRASGLLNTTGSYNCFVGQSASSGYASGYLMTTGSKNTILGAYNGNQGSLDIRTSSNYIVLSDGDGNPRGYFSNVGALHIDKTPFGGGTGIYLNNTNSQAWIGMRFQTGGSTVGYISVGTSSTSYVTSSDYRLKENVVYDWDATTRLKQLKPARFNFIADADTTVDGFLAHEAQAVVPECATGTHNEVDDDGAAVMQGIDQSKLVPLLVKTIQELEARITALEGN